jgi:hypothetical protein
MADGLLARASDFVKDLCDHSLVAAAARYTLTMTGNITLDATYPNILRLDADGSNRSVIWETLSKSKNVMRFIVNNGAAGDIAVRYPPTPTTVATLVPGSGGWFHCDGSTLVMVGVAIPATADVVTQWTEAASGVPASMHFHEDTDNGVAKVIVTAPAALAADRTVTWPSGGDLDLEVARTKLALITEAVAGTGTQVAWAEPTGGGASTFTCAAPALGGNRTLTWPDHSVTWGTFTATEFIIQDAAAPTKLATFDVSAVTAGQTRTITVPDANVDLTRVNSMFTDWSDLNEHTAIAASASLTNSNAETSLGNHQLAANHLTAGTKIRIRYGGRVTANNGATTLTVRVRLGGLAGVVILTTTAVDTAAGDIFDGELTLVVRAAPGAAVAITGVGSYCNPAAPGTAARLSWVYTPANYATNAAIDIDVTGQWSAADANACQLEVLDVEILAAA